MMNISEMKVPTIENTRGLSIDFLDSGLVRSIHAIPIRISLKTASSLGQLGANVYLRNKATPYKSKALLGPESNSMFTVDENSYVAKGRWDGIDYVCKLQLSSKSLSWQWSIELDNKSDGSVDLDLIYVQDTGLTPAVGGQTNEYYISQYLERRILQDDKYGAVICCRQNLKGPSGNPWIMIAAKTSALAASVDGMQFYGSTFRETGIPKALLGDELAGEYSGELSILALQTLPFTLSANDSQQKIFVASYLPDHPQATSEEDLKQLPALMQEFTDEDFTQIPEDLLTPEKNIFCTSPLFLVEDLSVQELEQFFGASKRHPEHENGQLLSFFCNDNNHVVLRAKEILVDRPHAHIMQAKAGFVADENIMTTTAYMYGVFNSHITQGNTNFNRLLSACSSQFNLEAQAGQRIFVEIEDQRYLLGVPSAFEIGLNHCRWIYKQGNTCFQIRTWTSKKTSQVNMQFKVLDGGAVNLLVSNQFDTRNSWVFAPGETTDELVAKPGVGSLIAGKFPQAKFRLLISSDTSRYAVFGDEALYEDGQSREGSFVIISVKDTSEFCMSFVGEVISNTDAVKIKDADKQWRADCLDAQSVWRNLSSNLTLTGGQKDVAAIREILPWYGVNALTHFLTPLGLEQIDGAAWGTRDVCQGPFELLLSMRKFEAAKQALRILFSNQNADGGWPQWWMFDSYVSVRAEDSHADIFHWCIISLSEYIKATGDAAFLDEVLPYYHADGVEAAEKTALSEHLDRLINMIIASFLPGTSLVPFGGGDWNDSMQPVSHELATRLVSTWTVELSYQAFNAYREVCVRIGRSEQAASLEAICENIKTDLNQYLIRDETVSGHGLFEADGSISLLLHPSDNKTNIQYRLLPMIRGIISGIFTPEQAQRHLALIEKHLKGPDGARLMNRPPKYNGGLQTLFQRAESSPYFGREIGIMYTHAHLRYAQVQARMGRADAFLKALRQAIPVAYRDIVPCGDIRQANCYFSSSDVTFKNRYQADEKYEDLKAGKITLKGGWRIYSSGPGIYLGLIVSHLLGLRDLFGNTVIDPVISCQLNGMSACIDFMGRKLTFTYTIKETGVGPKSIRINNQMVEFTREDNPYRMGGAVIPTDTFLAMLNMQDNLIEVQLH